MITFFREPVMSTKTPCSITARPFTPKMSFSPSQSTMHTRSAKSRAALVSKPVSPRHLTRSAMKAG